MAYTPVNWQTGDTITAERLNRMDRGWDVETTELFSETVTTAEDEYGDISASLAYSGTINADSLIVTFDGTEYTCPRIGGGNSTYYGGFNQGPEISTPDFTTYPFYIWSDGGMNMLMTETAGEHTVAAGTASIETSSSFDSAVVLADVFEVVQGTTTFQEACDAFKSGKYVCVVSNSSSGITYRSPVILVNESKFEIKSVSTMNSDTQLVLAGLSASSADGVLG